MKQIVSTHSLIIRHLESIMKRRSEISIAALARELSKRTGRKIRTDLLCANLLGTTYIIDCETAHVVNPRSVK